MNLVFVGLFLVTADGTLWASLDIQLAFERHRLGLLAPKVTGLVENCRRTPLRALTEPKRLRGAPTRWGGGRFEALFEPRELLWREVGLSAAVRLVALAFVFSAEGPRGRPTFTLRVHDERSKYLFSGQLSESHTRVPLCERRGAEPHGW